MPYPLPEDQTIVPRSFAFVNQKSAIRAAEFDAICITDTFYPNCIICYNFSELRKQLDFAGGFRYNKKASPVWWNWQTPGTQNPVSARTCGFDPRHRHHVGAKSALLRRIFYSCGTKKRHPPAPLLLLSESNPLRRASIRFLFFAKSVFVLRDFAFPRGCEPERENRLHYP